MIHVLFGCLVSAFVCGIMGTYFDREGEPATAHGCYRMAKTINMIGIVVAITYFCLGNK